MNVPVALLSNGRVSSILNDILDRAIYSPNIRKLQTVVKMFYDTVILTSTVASVINLYI